MFPKIDSVGTLDTKIDWSATAATLILGLCQIPVVLHQRGTSQCRNAIKVVQKIVGLKSLCQHTVRALPPVTQWWHLAWLSVFVCIFAV